MRTIKRTIKLWRDLRIWWLSRRQQPILVNVFVNSKIYGGIYDGEQLPINKWAWPKRKP